MILCISDDDTYIKISLSCTECKLNNVQLVAKLKLKLNISGRSFILESVREEFCNRFSESGCTHCDDFFKEIDVWC